MKKRIRRMMMVLLLILQCTASVCSAGTTEESPEYIIGVAVYDPDSPEMRMFMDYYKNYIEEGFSVKFYFSEQITSQEALNAFILSMKEMGAEGIISFANTDIPDTIRLCEENEIHYILGSGTISDTDYEAVKTNPWFLGCIGPKLEEVYQSGCDMAAYFLQQEAQNYIIMTGGASRKNTLHALRTQGMLETLQEQAGLILEDSPEKLAQSEVNTVLYNEERSVTVTLCPDYTEGGEGLANLDAAFSGGVCDVLMSAFHACTYLDRITEKEMEQNRNIMVGAIDSFTEENFEAIKERDAWGNPGIDYVQGKYASMAGPAFAMIFNAITGHPEANTPDGCAVRLYNGFWTAVGREEYIELYSYTSGIYENAYSCEDLMQVIKVFHQDASPQRLKELTEAYTVEDVKARILS